MLQFFQIDFDKVAEAGFRAKHRPTFRADQLNKALEPAVRSCQLVRAHERYHHGQWYLPLYDSYVRTWLKQQQVTIRPVIEVGGVEVECSKPAPPPDEADVTRWREHFLLVADNADYLVHRLDALEAGEREAHGKDDADRPAQVAALRRLLKREEPPSG